MLWFITLVCLSQVCEPTPAHQGLFSTQARCEAALVGYYREWRPARGAYAFRCQSRAGECAPTYVCNGPPGTSAPGCCDRPRSEGL